MTASCSISVSSTSRSSSSQNPPSWDGALNASAFHTPLRRREAIAESTIERYAFGKSLDTVGPRLPSSLRRDAAYLTMESRRSWNGPSNRGMTGISTASTPV